MEISERVGALDPLGADQVCPRLPGMNARRDVPAMVAALSGLLPSGPRIAALSGDECLAAMRDLGVFLGSIKRHGVEPVDAVPGLEPVLLELGRRTDMVPRDTIHHFIELNPTGDRQRLYTGAAQESCAIDTVRIPMLHFSAAARVGERLDDTDPRDPAFAVLLGELAGEFGALDTSMRLAHERLEPGFFFGELLPYTVEIVVAGTAYTGPAASHAPLGVLDTLLWESDHGSRDLDAFRRPGLPYNLPHWRVLRARWMERPSLLTRVRAALADPTPTVHDSAAALTGVLRQLVAFRGRHVTYARKGIHDERIDLLRDILDQTRQAVRLTSGTH